MKEGWEYKTIKECCTELFAGGDVPKPDVSKNKTQNFTVPIYTNGVENEGLYGYTNNARVYEPAVTISARGTIGATFRRYTPFYPAIRLITAVPNKDLLCIDYLYYALKTLTIGNSGTSIPQLTIPNIKNIVIPVPPLSEQQSIVNYLDSAFAKIDAMKANAEKSLNEAKALFQASLKEMLEPKEGWEEKKLKEVVITITDGDHQPPPKAHVGIPFITISNIDKNSNKIVFEDTFYVPLSYFSALKKDRIPQNGDVLYTVTGSFGIPVLIDFQKEFCFQRHIALIRPNMDILSPTYLFYWILSSYAISQAEDTATGAAQRTVSLNSLRNFTIHVPPIHEQQSIVATLDSLKSKVDRLQSNFEKISRECDALKQALLREVFEG